MKIFEESLFGMLGFVFIFVVLVTMFAVGVDRDITDHKINKCLELSTADYCVTLLK